MATRELEKLARVRQLIATGEARRLREAAEMSLGDVARSAGVYPATVQKWESGQRRPRSAVALRYLEVLDQLAAVTAEAAA